MKVFIKAQDVWETVVANDVDKRKDQMALMAIFQGVPEETLLLAEKETAKIAWNMLKKMYVGTDRVKEAHVQILKSEFEGLRMKETESVDDFAVRLTTLVNQIRSLGDMMEESYIVKKLLRAVSNKYLQIVSTIEQFKDLKTMMVEEAIGHLKVYEERLRIPGSDNDEHLFLTRAKWEVRSSKHEGGGSDGNGG